jgi:hypothetical protein
MEMSPVSPASGSTGRPILFGKVKLIAIVVLLALVALSLAFSWNARSALNLSFAGRGKGAASLFGAKKTLVDVTPWQTAQTVAALAVSAEETEYAHDAERLADHEVDQAFASALHQRAVLGDELLKIRESSTAHRPGPRAGAEPHPVGACISIGQGRSCHGQLRRP